MDNQGRDSRLTVHSKKALGKTDTARAGDVLLCLANAGGKHRAERTGQDKRGSGEKHMPSSRSSALGTCFALQVLQTCLEDPADPAQRSGVQNHMPQPNLHEVSSAAEVRAEAAALITQLIDSIEKREACGGPWAACVSGIVKSCIFVLHANFSSAASLLQERKPFQPLIPEAVGLQKCKFSIPPRI